MVRHSGIWIGSGEGIHHIGGPLMEWNFLSTLALVHFLWHLPAKRRSWLMFRSWLNLACYQYSSGCSVNNHGHVNLRWTGKAEGIFNITGNMKSLSQHSTICTILALCSIASAIFLTKFCVTSKNCAQWLYHLPWS